MSGGRVWWLSFSDPSKPRGFLGVVVTEAASFIAAVDRARSLGCNPGGEVRGYEVTDWPLLPKVERDRLLSRAELERLDVGESTKGGAR